MWNQNIPVARLTLATEVFLQRESRFNFYILRCVFCSCLREDSEGQAVDADLDSAGSLVKNIKMADSKANTEHLLKTEWVWPFWVNAG